MKTTDKYLVYFLLAAVVGLYILYFTGSNTAETSTELSTDTNSVVDHVAKKGRIYYVNTDSVWANYEWVKEVTASLEKKKGQFESQIEKQFRDFERDVNEFREKGPLMSEVEVQIKQRDLVRREQELSKLGEELEMKFLTEEKEWNDKLRSKIINFIEETTQERSYDFILGYSSTSNILVANDSLDLTIEIVQALNADYTASQTEK